MVASIFSVIEPAGFRVVEHALLQHGLAHAAEPDEQAAFCGKASADAVRSDGQPLPQVVGAASSGGSGRRREKKG